MATSAGGAQPLGSEAFYQEHFELLASVLDTRQNGGGGERMSGGLGGWVVGGLVRGGVCCFREGVCTHWCV